MEQGLASTDLTLATPPGTGVVDIGTEDILLLPAVLRRSFLPAGLRIVVPEALRRPLGRLSRQRQSNDLQTLRRLLWAATSRRLIYSGTFRSLSLLCLFARSVRELFAVSHPLPRILLLCSSNLQQAARRFDVAISCLAVLFQACTSKIVLSSA